MFSTCIFCHTDLGKNEAIEHFPVGRRLAFDAAKGRLWVVCRRCERWNLTPLEERWEAIEECERLFRGTKLRVSTDNIGLARVAEGTTLVRIGEPQRPEMAAWRYGDQFGRRRRKAIAQGSVAIAIVGGAMLGGPLLGSTAGLVFQGLNVANTFLTRRLPPELFIGDAVVGVPFPGDVRAIPNEEHGWSLEIPFSRSMRAGYWRRPKKRDKLVLTGEDALSAASTILPYINHAGGKAEHVTEAVRLLEETSDPSAQLAKVSEWTVRSYKEPRSLRLHRPPALGTLPLSQRLALEMALHENDERRALEGELTLLEERWKEAEEIAGISDDMFLPARVSEALGRMK